MLKTLPAIIGCFAIICASAIANDLLKTKDQQSSYVLGVEMANQYILSKDEIDIESMMLGMRDVFKGKKLQLSEDEMRDALMYYQDKTREKEQAMRRLRELEQIYIRLNHLTKYNDEDGEVFLKLKDVRKELIGK